VQSVTNVSLEAFVDLLLDAVFVVDREGTIQFVSAASERIFGYTQEEMIGRDVIEFVHPADRQVTMQTIDEILGGQPKPIFENRYLHKDGTTVHIMWSARWSEEDQVRVAVARDVSQLKQAGAVKEAVYGVSEAAHAPGDMHAMFRCIHEVIGELLPAANFCVVLADHNEDLRYAYLADHYHPGSEAIPAPGALIAHVMSNGESMLITPDCVDRHRSSPRISEAHDVPNWLAVPFQLAGGATGALAVYSYELDACYTEQDRELLQFVATQVAAAIERRTMRSELEYMAQHDPLTDLPNRTLFLDRLANALSRATREQAHLAILYLDLDDFKQVNDTYGHIVGDQLLQEVARRLTDSVRGSDTVGRLGGDEFVVLIEKLTEPEHVGIVEDNIRAALAAPYDLDDQILMVVPSIGVAIYPENGSDEDALIKFADDGMYRSKQSTARRQ
jgi:diguanylate cyclase (GGDEF)-like protein/PAS domain S-box-containing protein